METKEILSDIIRYLINKYSDSGITATERIDGCMSSVTEMEMNCENGTKTFKLALLEIKKICVINVA